MGQRSMRLESPREGRVWLDHGEGDHQWNSRKGALLREMERPYQVEMDWNQCFIQVEKEAQ